MGCKLGLRDFALLRVLREEGKERKKTEKETLQRKKKKKKGKGKSSTKFFPGLIQGGGKGGEKWISSLKEEGIPSAEPRYEQVIGEMLPLNHAGERKKKKKKGGESISGKGKKRKKTTI